MKLGVFTDFDPIEKGSEEERQRITFLSLHAENEKLSNSIKDSLKEMAAKAKSMRHGGAKSIIVTHINARLRARVFKAFRTWRSEEAHV